MPVGEFIAALSATSPSPAGGSVAALTVTFAASLCAMTAGLSARQLPQAEELAAEARRLRDQAAPLAQADAEAYGAVLAATRRAASEPVGVKPAETGPAGADPAGAEPAATGPAGADPAGAEPAGMGLAGGQAGDRPGASDERRVRVSAALARASEVPLEVARIGAGVASLASRLAAAGRPALRGDAAAAALLAAAAARTSAVLVQINAAGQPDSEQPARADQYASEAERFSRDAVQYARDTDRQARDASSG
ncbi:MAG TPA: cyclodeaminase/cyclohydrolase family protein [Streptosporangiaceae bacterium]